jgi:hypothetical protein
MIGRLSANTASASVAGAAPGAAGAVASCSTRFIPSHRTSFEDVHVLRQPIEREIVGVEVDAHRDPNRYVMIKRSPCSSMNVSMSSVDGSVHPRPFCTCLE